MLDNKPNATNPRFESVTATTGDFTNINNSLASIATALDARLTFVGRYTASNSTLTIPNINLSKYNYFILLKGQLNETTDFVLGFPDLSTWSTSTRDNATLNYGGMYLEWGQRFSAPVYVCKQGSTTTAYNLGVGGGAFATTTATGTSLVFHKYRSQLGVLVSGEAFVFRHTK